MHSVPVPYIPTAATVTNMMAGLDWEPLINRRRAVRMFVFYKMHSGLVAIYTTLYLTPRQYHTRHMYAYFIPHSRIDQHAFSFFPITVRLWNKLPSPTAQAPSLNASRPDWRHCILCKQNHFNSTKVHTQLHKYTHLKKTTLLLYIISYLQTNNTLSMRSPSAKIISLLMSGSI